MRKHLSSPNAWPGTNATFSSCLTVCVVPSAELSVIPACFSKLDLLLTARLNVVSNWADFRRVYSCKEMQAGNEDTVEYSCNGPATNGNLPIKETIPQFLKKFFFIFYIGNSRNRSNSWEKKSGRAMFSTLIPRQGVTFMLFSHMSLLLNYPYCISTFICIPEHFLDF